MYNNNCIVMILKDPLVKELEEQLSFSRNQPKVLMGLLTRHCHSNGHIFELKLVDKPGCGRWKQASETASHVLRDCEALAVLRFRHLGQHFLKSGDFDDISVSRAMHFVQSVVLLTAGAKWLHRISKTVQMHASL